MIPSLFLSFEAQIQGEIQKFHVSRLQHPRWSSPSSALELILYFIYTSELINWPETDRFSISRLYGNFKYPLRSSSYVKNSTDPPRAFWRVAYKMENSCDRNQVLSRQFHKNKVKYLNKRWSWRKLIETKTLQLKLKTKINNKKILSWN